MSSAMPDADVADVCASFQEAVVDVLVEKAAAAAASVEAPALCLAGGVAANSRAAGRFAKACADAGLACFLPSRAMCTDNAAMIAAAGWARLQTDGPIPARCRGGPFAEARLAVGQPSRG